MFFSEVDIRAIEALLEGGISEEKLVGDFIRRRRSISKNETHPPSRSVISRRHEHGVDDDAQTFADKPPKKGP